MANNVEIAEVYFCGVCRMCYPIESVASTFGAPKGDIPDYICNSCARFPVPHDWKSSSRSTNTTFRGLGQVGGFSVGDPSVSTGGFGHGLKPGSLAGNDTETSKRKFGAAFPETPKPPSTPYPGSNIGTAF